jgi:phosphoribosylaminoimidazole-succinocarboxamide synthase
LVPLADAFLRSGKVRDLYAVGPDRLLLVASDRISAFDVVLPTPIPDKGRVLTGLSRFWFAETATIVASHLLATDLSVIDPADLPVAPADGREAWSNDASESTVVTVGRPLDLDDLRGRVMVCQRADVLPIECVVRGYLAGSGWKDYQRTGAVSGVRLPSGLREGDRLPEPVFTPSTKAELGEHDQPIDFPRVERIVGSELAARLRDLSLSLYTFAAARCEQAGILLADTKFEFGVWPGPRDVILVDEVLTPDSSRFWDAETWAPGGPQPSYDKQFVREWLEASGWTKTPPGPELPRDVVSGTRERYVTAFERITGASFERYLEEDRIAP